MKKPTFHNTKLELTLTILASRCFKSDYIKQKLKHAVSEGLFTQFPPINLNFPAVTALPQQFRNGWQQIRFGVIEMRLSFIREAVRC
jgi:hypothetical protein